MNEIQIYYNRTLLKSETSDERIPDFPEKKYHQKRYIKATNETADAKDEIY